MVLIKIQYTRLTRTSRYLTLQTYAISHSGTKFPISSQCMFPYISIKRSCSVKSIIVVVVVLFVGIAYNWLRMKVWNITLQYWDMKQITKCYPCSLTLSTAKIEYINGVWMMLHFFCLANPSRRVKDCISSQNYKSPVDVFIKGKYTHQRTGRRLYSNKIYFFFFLLLFTVHWPVVHIKSGYTSCQDKIYFRKLSSDCLVIVIDHLHKRTFLLILPYYHYATC